MFARSLNSGLHRFFRRIYQYQYHQCSVRFINNDGETYYKSHLNLLTKEEDGHTYVEAFSPIGFRLSSGLRILGPCVLFPKSVLHWSVASSAKITPESLSLFAVLEPKPDILIIGIGDKGSKYDKNIIKFLRTKRINVEILPTEQACSTFNFLNSERRVVAAALIPPKEVDDSDDHIMLDNLDDETSWKTDAGQMKVLDNPADQKISKTMERFRDEGVMGILYESDRKREKRDREKKEKEEREGVDDEGKDSKR